jgi:hypothetical protein
MNFNSFGLHKYKKKRKREKVKRIRGGTAALRLIPCVLTGLRMTLVRITPKRIKKNKPQRKHEIGDFDFFCIKMSLVAARIAKGGTKTVKVLRSFCW